MATIARVSITEYWSYGIYLCRTRQELVLVGTKQQQESNPPRTSLFTDHVYAMVVKFTSITDVFEIPREEKSVGTIRLLSSIEHHSAY